MGQAEYRAKNMCGCFQQAPLIGTLGDWLSGAGGFDMVGQTEFLFEEPLPDGMDAADDICGFRI